MTLPMTSWLDTESSDLLRDFWRAAGGEEPLPRSLERSLAIALPVSLVKIASLHLAHAENWLRARGRGFSFGVPDRPLHGCLVAQSGDGIVFLDGSDEPDELRFTLAHEIAHFLADVVRPRRQAVASLGPRFIEVLDGRRRPSGSERFGMLISGIRLGPVIDLLDRNVDGSGALELWRCEERADRMALALLAPPALVLQAAQGGTYEERAASATQALIHRFGLPRLPAQRYAAALLADSGRGPSWVDSLRRQSRQSQSPVP